MREILLGTTNLSKIKCFQEFLDGYPVRFLTLRDMNIREEPSETGRTPEENAALKARFYGKYFDAVICQDSGLYFDGLNFDDPRQPGLNIRTPNGGKRLNDEEMISYYSKFLHDMKDELGERPLAYYVEGAAVFYKGNVQTFMENRETARYYGFYMVEKVSEKRQEGVPLDSLSLDPDTLQYFSELREIPKYSKKAELGKNEEARKKKEIRIFREYRENVVDFLVKALKIKALEF